MQMLMLKKIPTQRQFNLLHWFSLASLFVITMVAMVLGYTSTRLVVRESVERDGLLTAQFIRAIGAAELRHADLPPTLTMGAILDIRDANALAGYDRDHIIAARGEFLDHVENLPDILMVNIYARDRTIIWSTNPALIGVRIEGDEGLDQSFESKTQVSSEYHEADDARKEQKFLHEPKHLYIENYIPLFDAADDQILAMVEIYKEPEDLLLRIHRGFILIWVSTILGGCLIYFGLFWIVRRAAKMLQSQQKQLITSETFVALGEMSSAVAHSLRNPLATIRSSAELAQEIARQPAQKNIADIISQVDRMSRWVRELLVSLQPLNTDSEAIDLGPTIEEVVQAFDQQIKRANVRVHLSIASVPPVISQYMHLIQIFNSLFANSLEAMAGGGVLTIEVEPAVDGRVRMTLTDTGKGMTRQQEHMAFKPFFTTKQGGLGVGLMLVKRVMERFNGSVNLTSREQEGTQISLIFNVAGGNHGTQHTVG
ncbi:ATP-binding protein [Pseudomonas fluorescens]|uniref:histidine kinase n=1 Tax=Pseudomonas fluorescens TaxID=294 RepID=A0A5E7DGF3_PSEFL|nr:ATP-binding protein [Pseudomonas fluorescens]VVO11045.1 Adaptive-response sensory-kinase SasA [Pseudomonas fluorescens]